MELLHPASSRADIWAETLIPTAPDTQVVLRYAHDTGWLSDKAAMITRPLGKGSITYLGTLPEAQLLRDLLLSAVMQAHAWLANPGLPAEVELCRRTSADGRSVYVLINHNSISKRITLAGRFHSLLPDITLTPTRTAPDLPATQIDLSPQGVAVLIPETTSTP